MKILIESQFLPPVITFAYMIQIGNVVIEKFENYQKRSYRNRCELLSSSGIKKFSLPLKKGKNQQQCITDVMISYDQDWIKNFHKLLKSAYGKSPYFEHYYNFLEEAFIIKPRHLYEINQRLLKLILQLVHTNTSIIETKSFEKDVSSDVIDLRNKINPNNKYWNEMLLKQRYPQVFEHKFGFIPGLCILDLLFNLGPETSIFLKQYDLTLLIEPENLIE